MRSLELRIQDFLDRPLPDEIALNQNPDSLTETVLQSYASGQKFDPALVRMAQLCVAEIDQAMASVTSDLARGHLMDTRKLLVEVLQNVM